MPIIAAKTASVMPRSNPVQTIAPNVSMLIIPTTHHSGGANRRSR